MSYHTYDTSVTDLDGRGCGLSRGCFFWFVPGSTSACEPRGTKQFRARLRRAFTNLLSLGRRGPSRSKRNVDCDAYLSRARAGLLTFHEYTGEMHIRLLKCTVRLSRMPCCSSSSRSRIVCRRFHAHGLSRFHECTPVHCDSVSELVLSALSRVPCEVPTSLGFHERTAAAPARWLRPPWPGFHECTLTSV